MDSKKRCLNQKANRSLIKLGGSIMIKEAIDIVVKGKSLTMEQA